MRTTALRFFTTSLLCLTIVIAQAIAQESDEFDITEEPFRTNPSQEIDPEDVEVESSRVSVGEDNATGAQDQSAVEDMQDQNQMTTEDLSQKNKEQEAFAVEADPTELIDESKEAIKSESITTTASIQGTQNTHEGNGEDDGLVEVRSSSAIYLPYKQRQDRWGWTFSLGAEIVDFPSLLSQFDDNSFQTVFGSDGHTMPVLEVGPKFNFSWGSLGFQFGYSLLDISNESLGADNSLRIQRLSGTATFYLDALFSEGQFIPYGSFGIWQSEYAEETSAAPGDVREYSTEPGYHARFGALIGLDWLDLKSVYRSRRETGITAMFLNVYGSTSYMSESAPDPDLENEMDIGASLQFEF